MMLLFLEVFASVASCAAIQASTAHSSSSVYFKQTAVPAAEKNNISMH